MDEKETQWLLFTITNFGDESSSSFLIPMNELRKDIIDRIQNHSSVFYDSQSEKHATLLACFELELISTGLKKMSNKDNLTALKKNQAHRQMNAHLNSKHVVMSLHFVDMSDYK